MMTSIPSPLTHPSANPGRDLHPVLSAAIDCLDVELEAELDRYRRLANPKGTAALVPLAPSQEAQAGQTQAGQTQAGQTQAGQTQAGQAQAGQAQVGQMQAGQAQVGQVQVGQMQAGQAQVGQVQTGPMPSAQAQSNLEMAIAAASSGVGGQILPYSMGEYADESQDASADSTAAPETYLESSEELLRSLGDTYGEASYADDLYGRLPQGGERPRRRFPGLFTPLGVGLILLVGLSSLTLTYAFFNIRSAQVARQDASSQAASEADPLSPLSPNLTVGEFTKLDLGRLSALPIFRGNRSNESVTPPDVGQTSAEALSPSADPELEAENTAVDDIPVSAPEAAVVAPPVRQPVQPARSTARTLPSRPPVATPPAPPAIAPARPEAAVDNASQSGDAAPSPVPQALSTSSRSAAPQDSASQTAPSQNSAPRAPAPQTATPQTTTPQAPAPPAAPQANAPQSSPLPASRPQTDSSAAQPAAAAPANTPAAAPGNSADHRVVVPYTGDRSLQEVRQTVPEAYVRNSDAGAQVQLGVFESPARAEQLVDELAEQGINATVQP
ncbi:MAG: hypothetical protein ACFB5Z_02150 [Elainellaceae cyanobacterium]